MKKNQSRRDFLRVTTAGALGAIALSSFKFKSGEKSLDITAAVDPKTFGIALQLYTIRDAMGQDVPGSLKKVSDIGYKYLELAGYSNGKFYGYEPNDFKKLVDDLGMEILSSHTQVEAKGITLENAKKMADDHAMLGVKYCLQPWVNEEDRNIATYQKMVADWNKVGKIMKDTGIQFGYHNHNFEFANIDGTIPYFDIFLKELDKDLVTMELDMFWTTKSGQDPVEVIKKYPGRFELFHMKDMYTNEQPFFTTNGVKDFAPVGAGVIDFKRILAERKLAGNKYLVVEQDQSRDGKPFEDISTSLNNIITKLLV